MQVAYYPSCTENETEKGPIKNFLSKLGRNHPDLLSFVDSTLRKVEEGSNLNALKKNKWVERLHSVPESIFEFRIPPRRRGGVVRIYFCYKKKEPNCIILLAAELKKESDAAKTDVARKRYREINK